MSERDDHLFSEGPKRILSLDGGGVRGAITLEFLEQMEKLLSYKAGREVRLHEHFDMIGGTSTGAIIASALAIGMSAREVSKLYDRLAPNVFRRSRWRILGLQAKFTAKELQRELAKVFGEMKLDSTKLKTGLCMVAKRMDTGSPWLISNNPKGRYWEDPEDKSYIGNRNYPLAKLIRASTAAPHYFDPEPLDVLNDGHPGLFVDGGVSPHNNPSLQLFLQSSLPQHNLNWKLGPENLTIVSVGTGGFRQTLPAKEAASMTAVGLAIKALTGLIADTEAQTIGMMQALGTTPTPWEINSEAGDMQGMKLPGGPLFRFVRYDIRLEQDWLASQLGEKTDAATLAHLRLMDNPKNMTQAQELARKAAMMQVKVEHFT